MMNSFANWVLAALTICTVLPAYAQLEDTGAPPPWNKRFSHCSHPRLTPFDCPFDPWRNTVSSLTQLRSDAIGGNFTGLEKNLRALSTSDALFPDRIYKSSVVYEAIKEVVDNERDPNRPQLARQVLRRWREAVPDSQFVLLADALRSYEEAWDARGHGYAASVSPQASQLFADRLAVAEAKLLEAQPWVQETPVWSEIMIMISLNAQGVHTDWRVVFTDAVKRWPKELRLYTLAGTGLQPKWGGSWGQFEAFAEAAATNVQPTEGRSFYARIYSRFGDQLVDDPHSIRWDKLRAGFRDWIERSPDAYAKNRYASFACFARDKGAFKEAVAHIGADERYDEPWLDGYSFESCAAWASK